jgi:hypothetical protein
MINKQITLHTSQPSTQHQRSPHIILTIYCKLTVHIFKHILKQKKKLCLISLAVEAQIKCGESL